MMGKYVYRLQMIFGVWMVIAWLSPAEASAQMVPPGSGPSAGTAPLAVSSPSGSNAVVDFYGGQVNSGSNGELTQVKRPRPSTTPLKSSTGPQVLQHSQSAASMNNMLPGNVSTAPPKAQPAIAPKNHVADRPANPNQIYLRDNGDPSLFYSGVAAKNAELSDDSVVVYPGVTNTIDLSSTDENILMCPAAIRTITTSDEKGVKIQYVPGTNYAFIKFQFAIKGSKEVYATIPTELYVVCGDDLYKIISIPKRITTVSVRLSSGIESKIKKNISFFSGLPLERKILKFIDLAYKDAIPESFDIWNQNSTYKVWKNMDIVLAKVITAEGEGLVLKLYLVKNTGDEPLQIDEQSFLVSPFAGQHTLSVAICDQKFSLGKNEEAKVYIVEQKAGGEEDGSNARQQQ